VPWLGVAASLKVPTADVGRRQNVAGERSTSVAVRDCAARDGLQNPSSCSAGIDLLVPAVQSFAGTARKAESRPAAAPLLDANSTLAGRAFDRPSTVPPSREAVPILGIGARSTSKRLQFAIHRWGGWRCAEPWQRAPRQRASPAWAETASAGSVARPSSAAR
jgi:hypothetical protein